MKRQKPLKEALASRTLYDELSGKEKEIDVLEGFLKRLQLAAHQIDSSERPDFFIHFNQDGHQATIGCELTFYYSDSFQDTSKAGSAGARFFNQWKQFAKRLREVLDTTGSGLEHLYGAIFFREPGLDALDKLDIDRFLEEVVEVVVENSDVSNLSSIEQFDVNKYPILFQNVKRINLRNTAPETGILWWCAHLKSGPVDDPVPGLLAVIDEKNKKSQTYEWNSADERWLIIFAKAEILADSVLPFSDPKISDYFDRIGFDRVFLWNKFFETISEIYPNYVNVFNAASQVLYSKDYPVIVRPFIIRG
jgi:hypothetical protein